MMNRKGDQVIIYFNPQNPATSKNAIKYTNKIQNRIAKLTSNENYMNKELRPRDFINIQSSNSRVYPKHNRKSDNTENLKQTFT